MSKWWSSIRGIKLGAYLEDVFFILYKSIKTTRPTFFEAMICMSVTVQTLRHLNLTILDWLILKRGSIDVKAVVCVQHVWIQFWKTPQMSQSRNWYSIDGPEVRKMYCSVQGTLFHNNNISFQIKEMENRELPPGFFLIQNLILCFVLFCSQKVDAQALHLRHIEAENEANAQRWGRQSTEPALHSAEDIHRTASLSLSNTEEGPPSANERSLQLSCCLSFTLHNLADPIHPLSSISLGENPNQTLIRVIIVLNI